VPIGYRLLASILLAIGRGLGAGWRGAIDPGVVYAKLPGAQHSFDLFHSLRFEAIVDAIEAFAACVRSQGGAAQRARER
jgi:hypothetical protein